jgi:ribosomal protein S11
MKWGTLLNSIFRFIVITSHNNRTNHQIITIIDTKGSVLLQLGSGNGAYKGMEGQSREWADAQNPQPRQTNPA